MDEHLTALEFNLRFLLNKVINLRSETSLIKENKLNYKKISMLIENLDKELTFATERTPLNVSKKKIKRRNHAYA